MSIAIFDFDGTLYSKDSSFQFTLFVFKRNIRRVIGWLTYQITAMGLYFLNIIDLTECKRRFFIYFKKFEVQEIEKYIYEFWEKHYPRYFNKTLLERINHLKNNKTEILIITASPEILIKPLMEKMGVKEVIGTRLVMADHSVKIQGKNCRGSEKITRLKEYYHNKVPNITEAYSDNKDDIKLLEMAENAFLVSGKGNFIKL